MDVEFHFRSAYLLGTFAGRSSLRRYPKLARRLPASSQELNFLELSLETIEATTRLSTKCKILEPILLLLCPTLVCNLNVLIDKQ